MTVQSGLLTIFEGADCTGKTTLAKAYAAATGAVYHHHGPYPGLDGSALAKAYAISMLPALTGASDVVLDRCWLSEVPYGRAFRDGANRIGRRAALLERLAARCAALVVVMRPPWKVVRNGWEARKGAEYLDSVEQLRKVHAHYCSTGFDRETALPFTPIYPCDKNGEFYSANALVAEILLCHKNRDSVRSAAVADLVDALMGEP